VLNRKVALSAANKYAACASSPSDGASDKKIVGSSCAGSDDCSNLDNAVDSSRSASCCRCRMLACHSRCVTSSMIVIVPDTSPAPGIGAILAVCNM